MGLTAKQLTPIFDEIYANNTWTHSSGPGSIAKVNRPLIAFLSDFLLANRVATMCDFGCGDWQYMRHVKLDHVMYVGFDVSERILKANTNQFGGNRVKFLKTPDELASLPEVDLFLSKDTFMHLPNDYVKRVLGEARKKSRFVISVSNVKQSALPPSDIQAGQFRDVDLRDFPFCENAVDLFQYSQRCLPDPAYPAIVSKLLKRYVWPGRKSVQLVVGDRRA